VSFYHRTPLNTTELLKTTTERLKVTTEHIFFITIREFLISCWETKFYHKTSKNGRRTLLFYHNVHIFTELNLIAEHFTTTDWLDRRTLYYNRLTWPPNTLLQPIDLTAEHFTTTDWLDRRTLYYNQLTWPHIFDSTQAPVIKRRLFARKEWLAKKNKATLISLCSRGRATSADIWRQFRPLRLVWWALQGAQLWKGKRKRSHFFNWPYPM
jgi:hypothetical protein